MAESRFASDFAADGFTVARALYSPDEVASLRDHYMEVRGRGAHPGDYAGADLTASDPLQRFPRMIHMHRWDERSLRFLTDPRIVARLVELLGREPLAVQTMLYFKPPGARGQAPHQDNFYLRVEPGTCVAAWVALDRADEENGCMWMVPGSHRLPLLCTERADTTVSFTDVQVPVPAHLPRRAIVLDAGDAVFFHGSTIHGSGPNLSDRFRRALIAHYASGEATRIHADYAPIRLDGTPVALALAPEGGPCGTFVERDGTPDIEMIQREQMSPRIRE